MNYKRFFITTLLLALVLNVCAAPLQDVSVTSVDLAEESLSNKGDEHLFVTVTRVDDLIDDDGSVLAERVMAVRVTFDVAENQLRCNGVPVAIGVSNIEVQAQMASDPSKLSIESAEDLALLQDSFDVGLATVEVTATLMDEMTTPEGLTFRRIAVHEKITEINHEKVVQTEAGQQVLDIFTNGHVDRWAVDPVTGSLLPDNGEQQNDSLWMVTDASGCAHLLDPMVQWWDDQSALVRGAITGALCAFLFAVALFVRHLMISANSAYDALPEEDNQETIWDGDEQKTAPPSYEHPVDAEKQPFLT